MGYLLRWSILVILLWKGVLFSYLCWYEVECILFVQVKVVKWLMVAFLALSLHAVMSWEWPNCVALLPVHYTLVEELCNLIVFFSCSWTPLVVNWLLCLALEFFGGCVVTYGRVAFEWGSGPKVATRTTPQKLDD